MGTQRRDLLAVFRKVEESFSEKLLFKIYLKAFYQEMSGKSISACANMCGMNKDGVFGKLWQCDQLSQKGHCG